jgi:hypothetical protein
MLSSVRLWLLLAVPLPAIAAACGGDGGGAPNGATPGRTAPAVAVPARPLAFEDYPGIVAAYLAQAGDAALKPPCLTELMAAWEMPEPDVPLAPEQRCLTGNTDADPEDEVVVLLTSPPLLETQFGILSNVVVLDRTPDGYDVVYQTWTPEEEPQIFPHVIVAAEDITGDGTGEAVYTVSTCGAHTCTLTVRVLSGDETPYRDLAPEVRLETADLTLTDRNGDGVKEIVLHGGTIGSVGAGPQRARTQTYTWNGEVYELSETVNDASNLLYFAILDADAAFEQGSYTEAAAAYTTAVNDSELRESGYYQNEARELRAYALYRAALATLAGGGSGRQANDLLARARRDFPAAVNSGLVLAFQDAYTEPADPADRLSALASACLAVREQIDEDREAYELFWDFGYSNPPFDAQKMCPF